MKKQFVLVSLLVAVLMIGCAPAPAGAPEDAEPTPTDEPTAEATEEPTEVVEDTHTIGEPFDVAYGESAVLDGGALTLSFDQVLEDSRCPADAMCVQAGQAVVLLTVNGEEVTLTIPSLDENAASETVGEYTITLSDVQPYPLASDPHEHEEYVIKLAVAK
jgi:hypothetical protein